MIQRLILHLKNVPTVEVEGPKGKMMKKTYNTVNYIVKSEAQIADRLSQHKDNIAKQTLTHA
jgi:hypothetical protein